MPHVLAAIICIVMIGRADACTLASWYGYESGKVTASGAPFHPMELTAAHRTMKFGTRLRVTYHGRSVVVVITDRGPAKWTGRSLDLSKGAASALGIIHRGVACVGVTVVR